MFQDSSNYMLTAAELPAIRTLLKFQEQFGNDTSIPSLDAYCGGLGDILNAYPQVRNTVFKGWFKQILAYLNTTPTIAADLNVPVLYMLWNYKNFCNRQVILEWKYNDPNNKSQWTSFWHAFVNGQEVLYDAIGGLDPNEVPRIDSPRPTVGPWAVPTAPASWNASITAKIKAWQDLPPSQQVINTDSRFQVTVCIPLINDDCDPYVENAADGLPLYYAQIQVLSTWQNFATVAGQTPEVIAAAQSACVTDLMTSPTLTADTYFFLLHPLIALATSSVQNQKLAHKIVNIPTTSPENPNDSFINQLLYLILMHLADPLGDYSLTNPQLQTVLMDLDSIISARDAASVAIKQSLENHLKILRADTAYPMQDPYNPATGFNTRQTDTLAALDIARQVM